MMDRCVGFTEHTSDVDATAKGLPCMPTSVVYGHAAARGLDINRWTFGLDTGCVSHLLVPQTRRWPLTFPCTGLRSEINGIGVGASSQPRFLDTTRGGRRGGDCCIRSRRRGPGSIRSVTGEKAQVWRRWKPHQGFPRRRGLFRINPHPSHHINTLVDHTSPRASCHRYAFLFHFAPSRSFIPIHSTTPHDRHIISCYLISGLVPVVASAILSFILS